jgi:NAD(P)H-hydrate repair Nnr-like enzyme with NAD(P)H-hydrate dehydratase domain
MIVVGSKMTSKRKTSVQSDVVVDKQPGGNVVTLSEGEGGEGEGGVLAGGVLGLLAGGPGDLQRIIAEQAIALAACKEALEAKTIEMRTKLQDAMDLVSICLQCVRLHSAAQQM